MQDISSSGLTNSNLRAHSIIKPNTDLKKCRYRIQEDYGHLFKNIFLPDSKKIIGNIKEVRDSLTHRKFSNVDFKSKFESARSSNVTGGILGELNGGA